MKPVKIKLSKDELKVLSGMLRVFPQRDMTGLTGDDYLQHLIICDVVLKPTLTIMKALAIMDVEGRKEKKVSLKPGVAAVLVYYRHVFSADDAFAKVTIQKIISSLHQQLQYPWTI